MAIAGATYFESGVGVVVLTLAVAGVAFAILAELSSRRKQMSDSGKDWGASSDEAIRLHNERVRAARQTPPKSDAQKIAELRATIEKQAQENAAPLEAAVQFRKERDHWKANHDNQIKLKQTISRRTMITQQRSETAYDPHRREGCECAARARELAIANQAMSRELAAAHSQVQELSSLKDREQELIYAKNELQGELNRANQSLRDLRQHVDAVQSGQMQAELDRLKAELAAAPHWVPVAAWVQKYHREHLIVWGVHACESGSRSHSVVADEIGFVAERGKLVSATHVLIHAGPRVVQCVDPRGDGDVDEVVPDTDVTKLADEDAIRDRLLQPFLGSEAGKLGATTYRLRDGERWLYKCRGNWEYAHCGPHWFNNDTYRLAEAE